MEKLCIFQIKTLKPGSHYRTFSLIYPSPQSEQKSCRAPWSVPMFGVDYLVMSFTCQILVAPILSNMFDIQDLNWDWWLLYYQYFHNSQCVTAKQLFYEMDSGGIGGNCFLAFCCNMTVYIMIKTYHNHKEKEKCWSAIASVLNIPGKCRKLLACLLTCVSITDTSMKISCVRSH